MMTLQTLVQLDGWILVGHSSPLESFWTTKVLTKQLVDEGRTPSLSILTSGCTNTFDQSPAHHDLDDANHDTFELGDIVMFLPSVV